MQNKIIDLASSFSSFLIDTRYLWYVPLSPIKPYVYIALTIILAAQVYLLITLDSALKHLVFLASIFTLGLLLLNVLSDLELVVPQSVYP